MSMIIILFWMTLMGLATAYLANQRGRDPYIWFASGVLFGIFGILFLFLLPKITPLETKADAKIVELLPQTSIEPLSKEWFYQDKSGKQQGPISVSDLQDLWKIHAVDQNTFVWSEGMAEWKRVKELPALTAIMDTN